MDSYLMETQLYRITLEQSGEIEQWYKTSSYPITFQEFSRSTESLDYLVGAFVMNYERPSSAQQRISERISLAQEWYSKL